MGKTLLHKVWDAHTVRELPSGQTQLFVGLHLVHEVTSPQAFEMLRERGLTVRFPKRTFATVDHIVPTDLVQRPFVDDLAEEMMDAIEQNAAEFEIPLFNIDDQRQGVVHVIGPELGLTQPGMTIACGDSHTSTHGAFGAVAFGIGTSQVRDVLATQCLAMDPLKVRRIEVSGALSEGVYAKDVILHIIGLLGVNGGVGYGYEYGGSVIEAMSIEERMTVCNMSIEGGARVGYVNPDQTTYDYLNGRPHAPRNFGSAVEWWESMASDADAEYDDLVQIDGREIGPTVTWGITPGQSVGVDQALPELDAFADADRSTVEEAFDYMDFAPGQRIAGTKVDVAFIGSCTNGRLSDLRGGPSRSRAQGSPRRPRPRGAWVATGAGRSRGRGFARDLCGSRVPVAGSGLLHVLGDESRQTPRPRAMCSSSNRNFKGRQGSPTGRTLLMSPAMVAAAAVAGEVADVRELVG